jgi:flagellar hook assembly protein FlgD
MKQAINGSTPICDGAVGNYFEILLSAAMTVPSIVNMTPGVLYTFNIQQDSTGGRNFAWPGNVSNGNQVKLDPDSVTVQTFIASRTANLLAITPNQWIGV